LNQEIWLSSSSAIYNKFTALDFRYGKNIADQVQKKINICVHIYTYWVLKVNPNIAVLIVDKIWKNLRRVHILQYVNDINIRCQVCFQLRFCIIFRYLCNFMLTIVENLILFIAVQPKDI
jgi:hypothetical protein